MRLTTLADLNNVKLKDLYDFTWSELATVEDDRPLSYSPVYNQFLASLKREGKKVLKASDNKEIICIFRRNSDKNETTNRTTIFYPTRSELAQGNLVHYANQTFIVLNQETVENDIYLKSDLLQTNTIINTYSSGIELSIPVHAFDLQEAQPSTDVITVVKGQLKLITEDNTLSRALDLGNEFIALGGRYKVVNLYYKDGIAYIYVERILNVPEPVYTLTITGNTENIKVGMTSQLSVVAQKDNDVITNPTIVWSTSSASIATIADTGLVSFIAEGTVTITALWEGHMVSATKEVIVSPATPIEVYRIEILDINSYDFEILFGDVSNFSVKFYDSKNVEVDKPFKAELVGAEALAHITNQAAKQVDVTAYNNDKNAGKKFTLRVWNEELNIEKSQSIKVIGY